MRETRFRGKVLSPLEYEGKLKQKGKWIDGYLVKLQDGRTLIIEKPRYEEFEDGEGMDCGSGIIGEVYEVDPKTVGQYIGTKDKDDKKIYTGDILKWQWNGSEEEIFIVTEENIRRKREDWYMSGIGRWEIPSIAEVIGNIYDNPELLKKEE